MEDQPALRDDFNGVFRFCGVDRVAKKDSIGATAIGNDGLSLKLAPLLVVILLLARILLLWS